MNKHYEEAIKAAAVEQLKEQGYELESSDLDYLIDTEGCEEDWGTFEDDVKFLIDAYKDDHADDYDEPAVPSKEEIIEEICNGLKVGLNVIPLFGFGFAKDEEDLAKMREFVRGALTMASVLGQ